MILAVENLQYALAWRRKHLEMLYTTILPACRMEILRAFAVRTFQLGAFRRATQSTPMPEIFFLNLIDTCYLIEVGQISCLNFWEPECAEQMHILLVFSQINSGALSFSTCCLLLDNF